MKKEMRNSKLQVVTMLGLGLLGILGANEAVGDFRKPAIHHSTGRIVRSSVGALRPKLYKYNELSDNDRTALDDKLYHACDVQRQMADGYGNSTCAGQHTETFDINGNKQKWQFNCAMSNESECIVSHLDGDPIEQQLD